MFLTDKEIKMIADIFNDRNGLSDEEMDKLAKKLDLMVQYKELQDESSKKAEELYKEFQELDK